MLPKPACLMLVVLLWGLAGCTANDPEVTAPEPSQPMQAALGKWSRSCALCHVNGEGGAPTVGQTEQWQTRLEQGDQVILDHIVEGYNNMPPLGYCMDCDKADFLALTKFMAGAQ